MMADADRTQRSRDELLDAMAAALILLLDHAARQSPTVTTKHEADLCGMQGKLQAHREHLTNDRAFEEKHRGK